LNGGFKSGETNFPHGALIDDRIRVVAVEFGIVGHEVFGRGANALALDATDVADRDARGEVRVLTKVFEVAAIQRRAIDVESRAKEKIHAFRARVAPYLRAHAFGESRIPSSGKIETGGHSQSWDSELWHGPDEKPVCATYQINLLFQTHFGDDCVHAGVSVRVHRRLRGRAAASQKDQRH